MVHVAPKGQCQFTETLYCNTPVSEHICGVYGWQVALQVPLQLLFNPTAGIGFVEVYKLANVQLSTCLLFEQANTTVFQVVMLRYF